MVGNRDPELEESNIDEPKPVLSYRLVMVCGLHVCYKITIRMVLKFKVHLVPSVLQTCKDP